MPIKSEKEMTNRDIQAKEMRKKMLDTAKKLFAENGFHGTSMRSINRAVGMSEALTYHYFPGGKFEIFNTIIKESQEERTKDIGETIKSFPVTTPLNEALSLIAEKMGERFIADKEFLQIMIQERKMFKDLKDEVANVTEISIVESLVNFLIKLCEQGKIRKIDFNMAASQFMCHIGMIALQQIMYSADFDLDQYLGYTDKIVEFTAELWHV